MWIAEFLFPLLNMWSIGVSVQREEGRGEERPRKKKSWHFHSLNLINSPQWGTGWMHVIFSSFHSFPSPFLSHSLLTLLHLHTHTRACIFHPLISLNPHTATTPHPYLFHFPPSDSPEGAESSLTSQPAWQQPINYEWQVFGPIKAPPYFMHSKSDCRLLWRVAADMFIVIMAVGSWGWAG